MNDQLQDLLKSNSREFYLNEKKLVKLLFDIESYDKLVFCKCLLDDAYHETYSATVNNDLRNYVSSLYTLLFEDFQRQLYILSSYGNSKNKNPRLQGVVFLTAYKADYWRPPFEGLFIYPIAFVTLTYP